MSRWLFFHGLPGSPADQTLLGAAWRRLDVDCGDPFDPRLPDASGQHDLIGFSLGAMAALRVAARHPERVERLVLISPAAPLQLGDFLPRMAGQAVFRLARRAPRAFAAASALQAAAGRVAPVLLLRQLFATSTPAERALLQDPAFRAVLTHGIRHSLIRHRPDYCRTVRSYAEDWRGTLAQVTCPVTIWQGDQDRWTPPDMATALAAALPGPVELRQVPGAGHYGALMQAQP